VGASPQKNSPVQTDGAVSFLPEDFNPKGISRKESLRPFGAPPFNKGGRINRFAPKAPLPKGAVGSADWGIPSRKAPQNKRTVLKDSPF